MNRSKHDNANRCTVKETLAKRSAAPFVVAAVLAGALLTEGGRTCAAEGGMDGLLYFPMPDGIECRDAGGEPLWRVYLPGGPPYVPSAPDPDGTVAVNGQWFLDLLGAILRYLNDTVPGDPSEPGAECAAWGDLAQVTPVPNGFSDRHSPLIVDSSGNVCAMITHEEGDAWSLRARICADHGQDWVEEDTGCTTGSTFPFQAEATIDPSDNITVVFRLVGGGYSLMAMRKPAGGQWQPAAEVHHSDEFYQAHEVAADELGNVVAVMAKHMSSGLRQIWSIAYDATSGAWAPEPTAVSAPLIDAAVPTLARSRSGEHLFLLYIDATIGTGLWAHEWDSLTRTWGPPHDLPGTQAAGTGAYGGYSRFPMVVDENGRATAFWQSFVDPFYQIFASRFDGQNWIDPPEPLFNNSDGSANMLSFGYAHANPVGDVMGVFTRVELSGNNLLAARYRESDGQWEWDTPHSSGSALSTRVRTVFYNQDRAVVTLHGSENNETQLISLYYNGDVWSDELLDFPGEFVSFYQDPIDDGGEAVLVFRAVKDGKQGIKAAWVGDEFRSADVNGDGHVDVVDLLMLLAAWGNAGGPEDINCDGSVDVVDLLQLLSDWG